MEYDERTWSEWKIDLHLPLNIKLCKNLKIVFTFLHMHNAIIITKREVNAHFFVVCVLCSYHWIWIWQHLYRKKYQVSFIFGSIWIRFLSFERFFSGLLKKNREMKFSSLKIRIVCTNCGVFFVSLFISLSALQFNPNNKMRVRMHRLFFGDW